MLSRTTAQECETTLSGKKKQGVFAQLTTTQSRPDHMCDAVDTAGVDSQMCVSKSL